jgi:hypothetical protein
MPQLLHCININQLSLNALFLLCYILLFEYKVFIKIYNFKVKIKKYYKLKLDI